MFISKRLREWKASHCSSHTPFEYSSIILMESWLLVRVRHPPCFVFSPSVGFCGRVMSLSALLMWFELKICVTSSSLGMIA